MEESQDKMERVGSRDGLFAGKMVFLPGQWQKLEKKNLVKTGKNWIKWARLNKCTKIK